MPVRTPEAAYEKNWAECARCGTRRPTGRMEVEVHGWICQDHAWCQRQESARAALPERLRVPADESSE